MAILQKNDLVRTWKVRLEAKLCFTNKRYLTLLCLILLYIKKTECKIFFHKTEDKGDLSVSHINLIVEIIDQSKFGKWIFILNSTKIYERSHR